LRHVLPQEHGGVAELGGEALPLGFEHVADHHFRALGNEHPRLRRSLSAGAAADQNHFTIETCHAPILPD